MKKKYLLLPVLIAFALAGCNQSTDTDSSSEHAGTSYDYTSQIIVPDPSNITVEEVTSAFALSTSDGTYSESGSVYTITSGGTYVLSGKLDGQILVNAGDDDEVVLELNGTSLSYSIDSPIKAVNASKVEISAKIDTGNIINDNRSNKTTDVLSQGEGAISADCDLKLKGSGTLVVTGNYNNGIHTTKDLVIQKETLKVTAYNNAIKGKDSVTIESGEVQAYSTNGNGIKTENSDLSSKGNQRGTITINGGLVYVDTLHDAIDASYNIVVDEADSSVPTSVIVKTGKKSSSYTSSFKSSSEKGLKAENEIIVNKGTIVVSASDDAIHANYGTSLENGSKGLGNITINDGAIQIASGDDGLHSDNTLTINGGLIYVTGASEGLEANYLVINGGSSYIYGTDDGVNCSKKTFSNCSFTMNDGYLDVAVNNGDTDGIDSNGTLTIKGGIIVTRGAPGTGSGMSTGLDVDGTCSMSGGTLIAFNGLEKAPSTSSGVKYAGTSNANSGNGMKAGGFNPSQSYSSNSSYSFQAGSYTLSGDGINISFTNDYSYTKFAVYSSSLASNTTYTLSRSGSSIVSWTQSSNSVTIS